MRKWENFSKQELIALAEESTSISDFGKKIGYASFSKAQGRVLFSQYPEVLTILERNRDLTGQRFGRLVVKKYSKEFSQKKKDNHKYWECICDCGKTTFVHTSYLRNGNTKSCGCLQKEIAASQTFIDLTGEEFGNLLVIEQTERPEDVNNTRAYWLCKCLCGKQVIASGQLLRNGHKRSCGCLKESQYEQKAKQILEKNAIDFQREYTFKDLVGDNKLPLRFDFAIFKHSKLSYLIELQGQQHYSCVPTWGGMEKFEQRKRYDYKKQEYCKNNHIPLIVLSYKDEITEESLGLKGEFYD